ncbi:MAG: GIY-YIG nuclease family protein [Luteibaculum sp.]
MFYTYILYSESLSKYYVGYCEDLSARMKRHNCGYERYTKKGVPWQLVWSTSKESRSAAALFV